MSYPKMQRLCIDYGVRDTCLKVCVTPRCTNCQKALRRNKKAREAGRYGPEYRALRKVHMDHVIQMGGYYCARGGEWVEGTEADFDHLDDGVTLAFSCPTHNRSAGGANSYANQTPAMQQTIRETYQP